MCQTYHKIRHYMIIVLMKVSSVIRKQFKRMNWGEDLKSATLPVRSWQVTELIILYFWILSRMKWILMRWDVGRKERSESLTDVTPIGQSFYFSSMHFHVRHYLHPVLHAWLERRKIFHLAIQFADNPACGRTRWRLFPGDQSQL